MADPRRVPLITLSSTPGQTVTPGPLPPAGPPHPGPPPHGPPPHPGPPARPPLGPHTDTVRLVLNLFEADEHCYPEFSYSELLERQKCSDVSLSRFEQEELKEQQELSSIANKLEEKYGRKPRAQDRIQDLIDIGYGYDEDDSFIDNSEAYDEFVPSSISTKLGGFYINSGVLQFVDVSDTQESSQEHPGAQEREPSKKRKLSGPYEAQKKRCSDLSPMSKESSLSSDPQKKKRKKKKASILSVTNELKKLDKDRERLDKDRERLVEDRERLVEDRERLVEDREAQGVEQNAASARGSGLGMRTLALGPADAAGGGCMSFTEPLLTFKGSTKDSASDLDFVFIISDSDDSSSSQSLSPAFPNSVSTTPCVPQAPTDASKYRQSTMSRVPTALKDELSTMSRVPTALKDELSTMSRVPTALKDELPMPCIPTASKDNLSTVSHVPTATKDKLSTMSCVPAAPKDKLSTLASVPAAPKDRLSTLASVPAAPKDKLSTLASVPAAPKDRLSTLASVPAAPKDRLSTLASVPAAPKDRLSTLASASAAHEDSLSAVSCVPPAPTDDLRHMSSVSPAPAEGSVQTKTMGTVGLTRAEDTVPQTCPEGFPAALKESIHRLLMATRTSEGEFKVKYYTPEFNNILLEIDGQCRKHGGPLRSAVFSHLCSFLPCSKKTLLQRVSRLKNSRLEEEEQLKTLKENIEKTMPLQILQWKACCDPDVIIVTDEDSGVKKNEEPKKTFRWSEETRESLGRLLKLKMERFQREHKGQDMDQYLRSLLDTEVKPLWPKGWMKNSVLLMETRKLLDQELMLTTGTSKQPPGGPSVSPGVLMNSDPHAESSGPAHLNPDLLVAAVARYKQGVHKWGLSEAMGSPPLPPPPPQSSPINLTSDP